MPIEVTPVMPGTCLMSLDDAVAPGPACFALSLPRRLADAGDYRAGDIESGVGVGKVDEAADKQQAEAKQRNRERHLQRDEPVAQVPAADGERGLALLYGEAEIGVRAAQRGHQGGEEHRSQRRRQCVKKQTAVVLEMKFEGKVVSRGPADVAELSA